MDLAQCGIEGIPEQNFPSLALDLSFLIDLAGQLLKITETDQTSLVCDTVVVWTKKQVCYIYVTNLDVLAKRSQIVHDKMQFL